MDKKKKLENEYEGDLGIYAGTKGIGVGYGLTDYIYLDEGGIGLGFKLF